MTLIGILMAAVLCPAEREGRCMGETEPAVRVARVYDPPGVDDGCRVLVDRLWPRRLRKEDAQLDESCKEIAPSTELRKWYGLRPDRFAEFARRYERELHELDRSATLSRLRELACRRPPPRMPLLAALLCSRTCSDVGKGEPLG